MFNTPTITLSWLNSRRTQRKSANAAILRLTKEEAWITDALANASELRTGELEFFDRVFLNEINSPIIEADAAYRTFQYRTALKAGCFELQDARDRYRVAINPRPMHQHAVNRFIEVSTLLISPITPHYAQHIWQTAKLDKQYDTEFIVKAKWPVADPVDTVITRQ